MQTNITTILLVFGVFLIGCDPVEYTEDANGYLHHVITEGNGEKAQDNEYMYLNLAYYKKGDPDSLLFNSTDIGGSVYVKRPASFYSPMDYIFRDLKVGDSVEYLLTPSDFYTKAGRSEIPSYMEPDDRIRLFIGFKEILSDSAYAEWREELEKKQNELNAKNRSGVYDFILEDKKEQLAIDSALISNYLEEKGIEAENTRLGIRYTVQEMGNGPIPQPGSRAKVNYTGYTLDGTVFDSSIEEIAKENNLFNPNRIYEPLDFVVGVGRVIPGWDFMLTQFPVGTKATIYIPSSFAYGERQRSDVIQANTILVFDIEIVDTINA